MASDASISTVALFIAEVLYKSIREEEPNQRLFSFLIDSFEQLRGPNLSPNFHIYFMLQLSKYLGFYPSLSKPDVQKFFDKREGIFTNEMPEHPDYIASPVSQYLSQVLQSEFSDLSAIKLPAEDRKELLEHVVSFYEHHVPGMGKIKSHRVLMSVFN